MSEVTKLYKVLNADGSCIYGIGSWHLPTCSADGTWAPGDWMTPISGPLVQCSNGYHAADGATQLLGVLGPAIYEAEYRGERLDVDRQVVVREARLLRRLAWDDRIARSFACDCAEHVLHLFEGQHSGDPRPRQAIVVARRYADGDATAAELAAAWDAAMAAMAAARAAAWTAASAAAMAAASAATWDAAWAATWDAAWAAEREWQAVRLAAYLEVTE